MAAPLITELARPTVGGCHGPSNYERRSKDLQGYAELHCAPEEIDTLIAAGSVDLLLTHDAPVGVVFDRDRRGLTWASEAAGLDDLVRGLRPRVCLFGHHHTRFDSQSDGVRCIGPNKVRMPGNFVAIDVPERGRGGGARGHCRSQGHRHRAQLLREQATQHPRCLLVNLQSLSQNVTGGLVVRGFRNLSDLCVANTLCAPRSVAFSTSGPIDSRPGATFASATWSTPVDAGSARPQSPSYCRLSASSLRQRNTRE